MKKLFYTLLLFILLIPNSVCAVTVSQTGSSADISVAEFNALSGDKSGTTYVFLNDDGNITTKVDGDGIYGTSGSPVILDGYDDGDCDPINAVCSNSALLTGGLLIDEGRDYITIQDFRMTTVGLSIWPYSGSETSSNINIKRNYIYDVDGKLLSLYYGTAATGPSYVTVENNKMYGYGLGSGDNTSGGIYIKKATDIIIRGNECGGGDSSLSSDNVFEVHVSSNVLFEYNDIYDSNEQAGVAVKEDGSHDIILRFNKFHDNGSAGEGRGLGINWPDTYDIYVYGNYIYDNPWNGLHLYDGTHHVYVWSNIIADNGRHGILTQYVSGRGHSEHVDHIYIYNNTIVGNNTSEDTEDVRGGLIHLDQESDVYIKNNILSDNRPAGAGSEWHQVYDDEGGTYDYNTHYHPDHDLSSGDMSYYAGVADTLTEWNAESTIGTDKVENPGLTNPATDDYTLDGTNAIDDGVDLSECFLVDIQGTQYSICYDDALDPTSDWTGNASTLQANIATTKQDDNGTGWDRGAYAYPTSGLTITVTATDATATEESTTTGEWTIACSPNCAGETINFSYSGTATLDTDYDTANGEDVEDGTITITGANDTITLTPVDDDVQDIGEVAILTITSGTGYKLGSPISASITIEDNDGAQDQGVSGISGAGSGSFTYDSSGSGGWTR